MDAATMATMRLHAIAMAHLWLVIGHECQGKADGRSWAIVRPRDLGLMDSVLPPGHRIKVEITVEPDR